jgi:hypothetical protein
MSTGSIEEGLQMSQTHFGGGGLFLGGGGDFSGGGGLGGLKHMALPHEHTQPVG